MIVKRLLKRITLPAFFLCLLQVTVAQNKVVTGKITNSKDGSPLQNVSVFAIGTQTGTQTDSEGNFTLSLPVSVKTLRVSAVGFAAQDVYIHGKTSVVVALVATYSSLDDVVVIGYGTIKKKDLTGAVGSVAAKDFNKEIGRASCRERV